MHKHKLIKHSLQDQPKEKIQKASPQETNNHCCLDAPPDKKKHYLKICFRLTNPQDFHDVGTENNT
jgi:hypothetical protein